MERAETVRTELQCAAGTRDHRQSKDSSAVAIATVNHVCVST